MEIVLVIIGIVTLVGLIIFAVWFYDKKRSEALQAIANDLNFSFLRKDNDSLLAVYNTFALFSKGHSKKISNVMNGISNDMEITIMDYKYTVGSGRNSATYIQTLIVIQSSLLQLPPFILSPENIFHKIGAVFGYKDIDFSSHPKFSKQYLLRSDDEDSVRETFNDELLNFYEKDKGLSTEGDHDKFIYYRSAKRIVPKDIQAFLQGAINLYSLLKTQISGLH
jgi:hypothetical protein